MSARRALRTALLIAAGLVAAWLIAAASRAHLDDPTPTVWLLDRHDQFLAEIPGNDADGSGYWPVDALPWRVVACTKALEDKRFATHPGVDGRAVARAIAQDWNAGHAVSGASTIAMQVARMQDPEDRTLGNKAMEATVAVMLTARYGRDAIMAQYLRLAPYGNGVHGIAYAARRYFDKPVADLSWAETAFLVAIPQAPSRMDPYDAKGRARAVARGRKVLELAHEQGLLADDELALADAEIGDLRIEPRPERPVEAMHAILRYDRQFVDRAARPADGIAHASIDAGIQRKTALIVNDAVHALSDRGATNAAVMVTDVQTGEVIALVGSSGYFDTARSGAIDYTAIPRNPGSTLKPFLYALALDRGVITPSTVLDDLGRAPDGIGDADGRFLGPLLPRQALANSRNVPAVELLQTVGIEPVYGAFRDLRLHADAHPSSDYGLGLAIGGMPVTLEQLSSAYLALAGDGRQRSLSYAADAPAEPGPRVFTAASSRQIGRFLSDPMARLPSFPRMGSLEYPFPVAVKTGTSTDWRDAWTVAWSERYLVTVWVGDPQYQAMREVSGFSGAATIAKTVMLSLHGEQGDGLSDVDLPAPDGYVPVRVCALTGHVAGDACDRVVTEYFPPGSEPTVPCDAHVRVVVDGVPRTFVNLPPRYAAWQAKVGLPRPPGAVAAVQLAEAPTVRITTPRSGERYAADSEDAGTTVGLEADVDPQVPQVVWVIDGEPFATVDWPYATRWPITPGEHRIEARVPFTTAKSGSVRVTVQ